MKETEEVNFNTKPLLRVIGDVHGKYWEYRDLANQAEYSICVGDVGFNYEVIGGLCKEHHRIVAGNHENYHNLTPHFLGDFGTHTVPGFGDIFYVRGAFSIDWQWRTPGKDLFPEEELTEQQMYAAIEEYQRVKPDFVITHDCPLSIIPLMNLRAIGDDFEIGSQRTPRMLDMMWNSHHPKTWLYGHFHTKWKQEVQGTTFQCLKELEFQDFWQKP